jgi:hypothetical protein
MAFVHVFLTLFLSISFTLYSRRAYFSQFNEKVDISAPGVSVTSTVLGGGLGISTGTSMATPHVTGAIARVWSVCRSCLAAQVEDCLFKTADGSGSRTDEIGFGGVRTEDAYTCLVETAKCCGQEEVDDTGGPDDEDVPEADLEVVPRPSDPEPEKDVSPTCNRRTENQPCLRNVHCCSQKCNLASRTCSA